MSTTKEQRRRAFLAIFGQLDSDDPDVPREQANAIHDYVEAMEAKVVALEAKVVALKPVKQDFYEARVIWGGTSTMGDLHVRGKMFDTINEAKQAQKTICDEGPLAKTMPDGSKGTSFFKEIRKIALCADCVGTYGAEGLQVRATADLVADYCGHRLGELCPCEGLIKVKKEMVKKDDRIKALELQLSEMPQLRPPEHHSIQHEDQPLNCAETR